MAVVRQHRDQLPGGGDRIVFMRGSCGWLLPASFQGELMKRGNPRDLPVVIEKATNEDVLLYLSIRRLLDGYHVHSHKLENPFNATT